MASLQLTPDLLADLFEAHGDALVGYFMRRTFDADDSFDLAAETFAEAVACRGRFKGDRSDEVVAWLYGIARNQMHAFVRRGAIERRAMQKLGLERPPLTAEAIESIEREAGLEELRAAIKESIAQLPISHREAVRLRVLEERSYAETASTLQISEQTARAHVSRALRRLATVIPPSTLTALKEGPP